MAGGGGAEDELELAMERVGRSSKIGSPTGSWVAGTWYVEEEACEDGVAWARRDGGSVCPGRQGESIGELAELVEEVDPHDDRRGRRSNREDLDGMLLGLRGSM